MLMSQNMSDVTKAAEALSEDNSLNGTIMAALHKDEENGSWTLSRFPWVPALAMACGMVLFLSVSFYRHHRRVRRKKDLLIDYLFTLMYAGVWARGRSVSILCNTNFISLTDLSQSFEVRSTNDSEQHPPMDIFGDKYLKDLVARMSKDKRKALRRFDSVPIDHHGLVRAAGHMALNGSPVRPCVSERSFSDVTQSHRKRSFTSSFSTSVIESEIENASETESRTHNTSLHSDLTADIRSHVTSLRSPRVKSKAVYHFPKRSKKREKSMSTRSQCSEEVDGCCHLGNSTHMILQQMNLGNQKRLVNLSFKDSYFSKTSMKENVLDKVSQDSLMNSSYELKGRSIQTLCADNLIGQFSVQDQNHSLQRPRNEIYLATVIRNDGMTAHSTPLVNKHENSGDSGVMAFRNGIERSRSECDGKINANESLFPTKSAPDQERQLLDSLSPDQVSQSQGFSFLEQEPQMLSCSALDQKRQLQGCSFLEQGPQMLGCSLPNKGPQLLDSSAPDQGQQLLACVAHVQGQLISCSVLQGNQSPVDDREVQTKRVSDYLQTNDGFLINKSIHLKDTNITEDSSTSEVKALILTNSPAVDQMTCKDVEKPCSEGMQVNSSFINDVNDREASKPLIFQPSENDMPGLDYNPLFPLGIQRPLPPSSKDTFLPSVLVAKVRDSNSDCGSLKTKHKFSVVSWNNKFQVTRKSKCKMASKSCNDVSYNSPKQIGRRSLKKALSIQSTTALLPDRSTPPDLGISDWNHQNASYFQDKFNFCSFRDNSTECVKTSPAVETVEIGESGTQCGAMLDGEMYVESEDKMPNVPDVRSTEWKGTLLDRRRVLRRGTAETVLSLDGLESMSGGRLASEVRHLPYFHDCYNTHQRQSLLAQYNVLQRQDMQGRGETKKVLENAGPFWIREPYDTSPI